MEGDGDVRSVDPREFARITNIDLDGSEVLDRVDDMLAWMAVAGESKGLLLNYRALRRAEPLIDVGGGDLARLAPHGAVVTELPDSVVKIHQRASEAVPIALGSVSGRVRFSRVVECSPDTTTWTGFDFGARGGGVHGKDKWEEYYVGDGCFEGVVYKLESIHEPLGEWGKRARRHLRYPPQGRLFHHQLVLMFRNGVAMNAERMFGFWGGRLFGEKRERLKIDACTACDRSESVGAWLILESAAAMTYRQDAWSVELALAPGRSGVALDTDAIGSRDFVKILRNNETPKGRRKSLVHWVNEHMRRRRKDDAEPTIPVKGHLRGVRECQAGRYHARIWPAGRLMS